MPFPLGLVVIPGGVALAVAAEGSTPNQGVPTKTSANGGILVSTGAASSGSTIKQQLQTQTIPIGASAFSMRRELFKSTTVAYVAGAGPAPQNGPIDQLAQQKLDEVKKYAQGVYDNMADDAKKAAAKELSKDLKLDPPLSGDETWEDMAKIAGGAAGLVFSPLPGGAIWGPIVGAYLGVKLEELMAKNLDDIKAWFKGRWSDVEGWVKGVAGDVEDAVNDVVDYLGGIF